MKYTKIISAAMLIFVIGFSLAVSATSYEITDFGIKNIDVPQGYMSCSMDACDEALSKLLKANGFSHDDWRANVMQPSNFQIYSCQETNPANCMYLICEKLDKPKTADGLVTHKYAADYNLIADGEDRAKFADEKKKESNLENVSWTNPAEVTPFIEYSTMIDSNYCHCYETVYNGNRITLMFSSDKAFSANAHQSHAEVLNSLVFSENVDYTEVKKIINDAVQKKLEEETNSGENTKILRIIISASLVLVIALAVFMSIRSQNKKRKRSIIVSETQDQTEDN